MSYIPRAVASELSLHGTSATREEGQPSNYGSSTSLCFLDFRDNFVLVFVVKLFVKLGHVSVWFRVEN